MNRYLHLMYVPNEGWGVFVDNAFPHSAKIPEWFYRTYEVPDEREREVFKKLLNVIDTLSAKGVEPSPEIAEEFFPPLEELLKVPSSEL